MTELEHKCINPERTTEWMRDEATGKRRYWWTYCGSCGKLVDEGDLQA